MRICLLLPFMQLLLVESFCIKLSDCHGSEGFSFIVSPELGAANFGWLEPMPAEQNEIIACAEQTHYRHILYIICE